MSNLQTSGSGCTGENSKRAGEVLFERAEDVVAVDGGGVTVLLRAAAAAAAAAVEGLTGALVVEGFCYVQLALCYCLFAVNN